MRVPAAHRGRADAKSLRMHVLLVMLLVLLLLLLLLMLLLLMMLLLLANVRYC